MNNIGTKITEIRENQGMTRYRLALNSGISFSYLTALEKNDHSPSIEILQKVALALGVTVSELIDETRKECLKNESKVL